MHDVADFRSDKCALPTPEMLEAMADVSWGDGQADDGGTVQALEAKAAALTGKPAAVFVPTGTMANQLAIHAQTRPGDGILLDAQSHIYLIEAGNAPALSGVQTCTLPSDRGIIDLARLEGTLKGVAGHGHISLVATEQTHNFCGGAVLPLEYLRDVRRIARRHHARVHLDGARVTNASVKSGIAIADYAATADSVMFCLSKGLCAPAGSMLCGDAETIARARAFQARLGGRPKQAAPLARCGIIALETMLERLADDHASAARFAGALAKLPRAKELLDIEPAETNMVFVTLKRGGADALLARLEMEERVRAYHLADNRMRFVTHRDVDAEDVDRAAAAFGRVLSKGDRA